MSAASLVVFAINFVLSVVQEDIYFNKMTPDFLLDARAAAATHAEKLAEARTEAAMAAHGKAVAGGANAETAAAAGRAAAAAVVRLPDDPLDKVQRHEEQKKAHAMEVDLPSQSKPLKRKMGKAKARAVAAVAAGADVDEDDRAARPPPPNCDVLRALLRAKGLKTGGKKAELVQRLAEAEACEAEDDEPGASNAGSAVAEASDEPEAVQARRKRLRRAASNESEDDDGCLFDAASIEDDSASPPAEPLAGDKRRRRRRASPAAVPPRPADLASSADHPAGAAAITSRRAFSCRWEAGAWPRR